MSCARLRTATRHDSFQPARHEIIAAEPYHMLLPVAPKHKLDGLKYSLTYRKRLCQPFCV